MQARRDELPTVVQAENGMPVISIDSSDKKFTELVAATLIEGDGPQVTADSWIRANFVAVDFDTGEIVQSSWVDGKGPAAVHLGVGEVPAGWDLGLVDQREGSEVLLVVPPNLAYGDATLVYVVDILAVWTPE
jgi:peptidylprolyl isomerase